MTQTAYRLKTRALSGKRLEVTVPELNEGEEVELIVLRSGPEYADAVPVAGAPMGVWDWLQSLPRLNLTMEDWERIERELQEEKDASGTLTIPSSDAVYVDANTVLYTLNNHPVYAGVCAPLWQAAQQGTIVVVSSELILLEMLVIPLRAHDHYHATLREKLWTRAGNTLLPITRDIPREAANLRAKIPGLKTPDASHAATALHHGCALFVTNDLGFRRVPGLALRFLDDILTDP